MSSRGKDKIRKKFIIWGRERTAESFDERLCRICMEIGRDIGFVFNRHLKDFDKYRDQEIEMQMLNPLAMYISRLFAAKRICEGWMMDEEEQDGPDQWPGNPSDPEQVGAALLKMLRALTSIYPAITDLEELKKSPYTSDQERELIVRYAEPVRNNLKQKLQSLHQMPGSEQVVRKIISEFPECVDWITEVPRNDS